MRILNVTQPGRFSEEEIAQARVKRRETLEWIRLHRMPGASDQEILARYNGYVDPDPSWGIRFLNGQIVREK